MSLHTTKTFVQTVVGITRLPGLKNKSILPTFTKSYPCHPKLVHRFFIPKSHKAGDAPLPLYVDIHGGGFLLFDARSDDKFCSNFANDNKVVVISIEYSLTPGAPFPAPVHEVTDAINAILEDESLPIDRSKVAVGGFSAGGNLSLAASQRESLQGKIGGIVAVYPVVDFTKTKDAKFGGIISFLLPFDFAYIPPDQDLKDPLLSVTLAPRERLPKKICLVGCERDWLARDAEILAERLAESGERKGDDVVWEMNGVRWEKILGRPHWFDQMPAVGAQKALNDKMAKEMYDNIAEWLFREVYV